MFVLGSLTLMLYSHELQLSYRYLNNIWDVRPNRLPVLNRPSIKCCRVESFLRRYFIKTGNVIVAYNSCDSIVCSVFFECILEP